MAGLGVSKRAKQPTKSASRRKRSSATSKSPAKQKTVRATRGGIRR